MRTLASEIGQLPGPPTWHEALLSFHVLVAATALLIGPVALWARKRRGLHTRTGETYFWLVSAVSATGGALALLEKSRLFFLISVVTFTLALLGYLAARKRWQGWLLAHVGAVTFSYVSIAGAFVFTNWHHVTGEYGMHSPIAVLLPSAVGTVAVTWLMIQVYQGKRPRL